MTKQTKTRANSVQERFNSAPFVTRHIGPDHTAVNAMLSTLEKSSLQELMQACVPAAIRLGSPLTLGELDTRLSEEETLGRLEAIAKKNKVWKSFLGLGYYDCITPTVIARNILENPCWYTQYTPYQPEISQGRLEALLNFQTLVSELSALPVANASLLDEATAAAEAMAFACAIVRRKNKSANTILVDENIFPQTLAVVQTRAEALDLQVKVVSNWDQEHITEQVFAVLLQYPAASGAVVDITTCIAAAKAAGALSIVACDLLALTLLKPPGELGADVAVGNAQRFGVPMGFGGPSAAFFATREEYKRLIPGRIVGVSKDAQGKPAIRLALQTREQHIRREKATSNICTAQVLLANMASMYAVYHGPEGLKGIAQRVNGFARRLVTVAKKHQWRVQSDTFFDTVEFEVPNPEALSERVDAAEILLYWKNDNTVRIAFDETMSESGFADLLQVLFGNDVAGEKHFESIPTSLQRQSKYLQQAVFNSYHSETEFLRYVHMLENRDLSLATSMIPLGSCTMKLNATSEMVPVSWKEFSKMHPFAPASHTEGYQELINSLKAALSEITGLPGISLQPNAGSQGEYSGLLVVKAYHEARGDQQRTICLIPKSAHGTNPASAVMAGMQVVVVECDNQGNIDVADLKAKAAAHSDQLAALMVTYPSTHGVFEETIQEIAACVHEHGGQVYMDGANLNALVGLSSPAVLGADVMHINLHKTFCIPHGGGGPGMGPIAVAQHLAAFLPGHPLLDCGGAQAIGAIAAAPYGSASILPISWMYIALMGSEGLQLATEVAILNANYIAKRLSAHCDVLYTNTEGYVAHECILDVRPFKESAGVGVEDIAKRLMDYGFHAPTVSFPVPGTLMIEPTESESKAELDRFCDAMISIFGEIKQIEQGRFSREDNPLINAPHTAAAVTADTWDHPYSREQAAFPTEATKKNKFWPYVARIDGVQGDRNLVCTCPDLSEYDS